MPPGMSIEQFKAGVSRIRNPVIARVFGELELIEEWGSGYKRIKESCSKGGYPEPIWEELGTVMRVTFFPHPETQTKLGAKISTQLAPSWHPDESAGFELSAAMIKLISFCQEPKFFSEIVKEVGGTDRTKFRRKFLHPLIERNLLTMTIPEKPHSPNQQYLTTFKGKRLLK
jgi:ATP-dependent DNA helicase RecG